MHHWIVARTENNRVTTALRFLTLSNHAYYAPRARMLTTSRAEIHPLLFSPYIFVEMIDGQYGPIKRTLGIASVVLRGDTPAIVPPTIMTALRRRKNANGLINVAPRLRRGTRVQIARRRRDHVPERFMVFLKDERNQACPALASGGMKRANDNYHQR